MATNNYEAKECIFQWKIENASQCWWLKNDDLLESPDFIADALLGTKWSLLLNFKSDDGKHISIYLHRMEDCNGPDFIEINYEFAFLDKDGKILTEKTVPKRSFSKDRIWGYQKFMSRDKVFATESEAYLPDDTLTVQCILRKIDEKLTSSKYLYARTSLKVNKKYFDWPVMYWNVSTFEADLRYEFKDTLLDFHLILNTNVDRLDVNIFSFCDEVAYISFKVFIQDSDGKKENCGVKTFFDSDLKKGVSCLLDFPKKILENKSRYMSNDAIRLDIEYTCVTTTYFGGEKSVISLVNNVIKGNCCIEEEKSENKSFLLDDLKSLYNDGLFNDTEIRTFSKSFPSHKGILSARSPVFKRMFSNDMKEVNSGHIDIADFEDDTVHRMLLYIYTDTLEDLQFESAIELYKIADKYEIQSLKSRCCSFFRDNLCPSKVCDVLVLADLHQDGDLKNAAEDYILNHAEVFSSLEWKGFMDKNIKLAADVMYKKVNTVSIYEGNK